MNRTPPWGDLPALALANVYKYLDPGDLLKASSTCWHWRSVLFQKSFFRNFKFKLNLDRNGQYNFFMQNLYHLTSELTVVFDFLNVYHIDKVRRILYKIARSDSLVGLRFHTNCVGIGIPGENEDDLIDVEQVFVEPIKMILNRRVPSIQVLDLGAMECLTYYATDFLKALSRPQELQEMTIASIKYDPCHYPILTVENVFFEKCTSLQVLSLDYDTLNEDLLKTIQILPLKTLMICVHGLDTAHSEISNAAWAAFSSKFKNINLILTLIYAYEAVEVLQHSILRRNMPLTHLRVLFCNYLNMEALHFVSDCYEQTLKSVQWIDTAMNENGRNVVDLYLQSGQDPFVMMSWRCKNLEEIVIHGYMLDPHNLIGISRLRGQKLKKLEVSMLDSMPTNMMDYITEEISNQLGQKWQPYYSTDIPPALGFLPTSEDIRDEYILNIIRSDLSNP